MTDFETQAPRKSEDPFATLTGDSRTMPIVMHAMYLLGYVTLITPVVGVIIAYVGLSENDWRRSHYLHAIYTFWLALAGFTVSTILLVIGIPLSFVLVGIPFAIVGGLLMTATGVWYGVRVIVALVYACKGLEYPRPRTLLI